MLICSYNLKWTCAKIRLSAFCLSTFSWVFKKILAGVCCCFKLCFLFSVIVTIIVKNKRVCCCFCFSSCRCVPMPTWIDLLLIRFLVSVMCFCQKRWLLLMLCFIFWTVCNPLKIWFAAVLFSIFSWASSRKWYSLLLPVFYFQLIGCTLNTSLYTTFFASWLY